MSEWDEYDEAMDMAGLGFGFGIIIVAMSPAAPARRGSTP